MIDTAGMRKKSRISDDVEHYSILRAVGAIERSDVCVIMLSAEHGITEQDTKIAGLAHNAGKASIVVVNKWDLIEKDHKTADIYKAQIKGACHSWTTRRFFLSRRKPVSESKGSCRPSGRLTKCPSIGCRPVC